jgi:hypothetical protein
MDENPYQAPQAPLTKRHKASWDWTSAALVLLVIYASTLILVMLRTSWQ